MYVFVRVRVRVCAHVCDCVIWWVRAVVERGGFLWVFYGSKELPADERPPIPYVPELGGWV